MLRPSYSELMDILNQDAEMDNKITSRYSIVIAAAKRARQIIDGAPFDASGVSSDKAVSIAINEMRRGLIKFFPEGLEEGQEGGGTRPAKPVKPSAPPSKTQQVMVTENLLDLGHDDDDDDEYFEDEAAEGTAETKKKAYSDEYGYDNPVADAYEADYDDDYGENYDDGYEDKKDEEDDYGD